MAGSGPLAGRPSGPDFSGRARTGADDICFLSLEPQRRDTQAPVTPKAPDIVDLETPAPVETGLRTVVPVVDGGGDHLGEHPCEHPAADATDEKDFCQKPSDKDRYDDPCCNDQYAREQHDRATAKKDAPEKAEPCVKDNDGAGTTTPDGTKDDPKEGPNEDSGNVQAAVSAPVPGTGPADVAAEGGAHDGQAPGPGPGDLRKGRGRKVIFGLKLFAIVFLSLLVLLLSSILVVQLNVDRFTSFALEEISRKTGTQIEFSGATMRLFPMPAIGVNHVRVVVPQEKLGLPEGSWTDLDFRAHAVYFSLSILALLNGELEPRLIVLDAPAIVGTLPVAFHEIFGASEGVSEDEERKGDQEKETLKALNDLKDLLPYHCVVKVYNGGIALCDIEGRYVRADNLTLDLSFTNLPLKNPLNGIRGSFAADRACVQTKDFAALGADLRLSGKTTLTAPLQDLTCEMEGRFAITPLNFAVAASLKLHGDRTTLLGGGGRLKGFFVFDGAEIPYDIVANVGPTADAGKHLALAPSKRAKEPFSRLTVSKFELGDDVLAIDAVVFPDPANPGAAGRLSIEKLSLTRWLAFARDLSPGLQRSLDRITDGHIDFYIDTNHLVAPNVLATAANATFAGKGGIADWKAIEIFLDMESDFVDLGVGIAESVGVKVAPQNYGHRPLTDMRKADIFPPAKPAFPDVEPQSVEVAYQDGSSKAQDAVKKSTAGADAGAGPDAQNAHNAPAVGESGKLADSLSYDIRLMSHNIHYGYIDLTEGGVVIHPGRNSKGVPSAQIDMRANLHGGTITGYGHFTDENLDEKTEYEFHVEGKDVDLGALHKQLTFVPIVQGTGGCVVDVTSEGSEIDDFLANLRGRVRAISSRTRFLDDRLFSPLRADVILDLQSAAFKNSALGLNGSWSVACEGNAGWQARFRLPGQIWFGGEEGKAGVHFTNLALNLEAKRVEKLFKALGAQDVDARISGRASLDTSQKNVRAEGADITLPGLHARGTVGFAMKVSPPTVTGSLFEAKLDVPKATRTVTGKAADIPKEFHAVTLAGTEFSARDGFLGLSRFKAQTNGMSFSGSLSYDFSSSVPKLAMDVRLDALDLDARHPEKERGSGKDGKSRKTGKAKKAGDGKPLDYSFMKKVDADGTLHLERLRTRKTTVNDVQAPFSLKGGKLSLPGARGKIYGGTFWAAGTCDFSDGLAFSVETRVNAFDLGELMRDRGSKDIFTGKVDFTARLSSTMKREGELARNLNGHVAFASGRGSFQGAAEKGRKESPILFNEAGCTAEITNGVLRTKNFRMTGDSLRLTGEGWIDLGREELDLQLVADMNNLPNIPMRIHGSFDNPRRDISGGMVILNALGGIARGAFNVVVGVFFGIFGIFR